MGTLAEFLNPVHSDIAVDPNLSTAVETWTYKGEDFSCRFRPLTADGGFFEEPGSFQEVIEAHLYYRAADVDLTRDPNERVTRGSDSSAWEVVDAPREHGDLRLVTVKKRTASKRGGMS